MQALIFTAVILFSLAGPVAVLAEAPAAPLQEMAADASATGPAAAKQPCPMHGMGMKGKGKGMGMGMGQGGTGPGGSKPGCDHSGHAQQDKHAQVLRRLDMIEARIAKIEVMLESLMQR